ncbi:MAG: hypothetical protein A2992_00335 [Elusimicrobia bacterium RIFCSPLOWO2_01_FULL_59_12]|nr:MAG: hypothetical protein A2992_00335 [Elusimicrobia bacterium RIFCSPLOWO2_01_FULL_59_12]
MILVCVGSELLRGKLNTHVSHVSRRLASIGLEMNEECTVHDRLPEIAAALRRALENFQVVLVSGGLGPTFDDLTREAASEATGRPLSFSKPLFREIQAKFRRARHRMPPANARQAYVLDGAESLANHAGTAPGQWLDLQSSPRRKPGSRDLDSGPPHNKAGRPPGCVEDGFRRNDGKVLALLPGPPRELYPMLESAVLPRLKKIYGAGARAETHLHFVGVPESAIDDKIRPIIHRESHASNRIQFTILAHLGLVDLDIFVSAATAARARAAAERISRAVRRAAGKAWYGSDDAFPLEKVVGDRFRRRRATLAVAESCTGGMLASRLTDVPGSSDYFLEGCVTYANTAKVRELSVPESLLKEHGAVSRPAALAMAKGIRRRAQATWGVGITGVAGPGGGTAKKPVGLVYIALASKIRAVCRAYHFTGDRGAIRRRAVLAALDLLRRV